MVSHTFQLTLLNCEFNNHLSEVYCFYLFQKQNNCAKYNQQVGVSAAFLVSKYQYRMEKRSTMNLCFIAHPLSGHISCQGPPCLPYRPPSHY